MMTKQHLSGLSAGVLIEHGPPSELAALPGGVFAGMMAAAMRQGQHHELAGMAGKA